jgi:hypothetical protein
MAILFLRVMQAVSRMNRKLGRKMPLLTGLGNLFCGVFYK